MSNNQHHAFLRKTIDDSVDRYRTLLLESIEEIAKDLATTIEEASLQDKRGTFRISHGLTIDLDKAISSDKIHWSITRSASSSGPTPGKEDLEKQESDDQKIWESGKTETSDDED